MIELFSSCSAAVNITDQGRPVRKLHSLHGRKSTPTPKFVSTDEAYFVCHIGPSFQISLIYAFIGCPYSVVNIIKFCCHQLKDCIKLKLPSYCFTTVNPTGRKPDGLDNKKQKCLLFFGQNQGISAIVSPKNGTKKSLLKLALLESYQPHQPRGYGCGQHKTPAPPPMHARINSIKKLKRVDQNHDSIIIQPRLPGLRERPLMMSDIRVSRGGPRQPPKLDGIEQDKVGRQVGQKGPKTWDVIKAPSMSFYPDFISILS